MQPCHRGKNGARRLEGRRGGITVAGGRAGTVGVGGFISGGGIIFFAASHGMACDSIVNFEVVLATPFFVTRN